MHFRLLGSVESASRGRLLGLGGPKQRSVLALLLLDASRSVAVDQLIEGVWGSSPPLRARATIQVYVSNLRKILATGWEDEARPAIVTNPPGYMLEVDPCEVDVLEFRRLAGEGRRALGHGAAHKAEALLAEALGLWRGPALAGLVDTPLLQTHAHALEVLRLDATEEHVDARLALGRHHELVPELQRLVGEQPTRERLIAQLLLALYRSGRQSDALAACRTARRFLSAELGLDPGPGLQDLERRILRQDPTLALGT